MTDATSETALDLEGDEGATLFDENRGIGLERGEGLVVEPTLDRAPRERKQEQPRLSVDVGLRGVDIHLYQNGIVTR
jgi:hypothetical protein